MSLETLFQIGVLIAPEMDFNIIYQGCLCDKKNFPVKVTLHIPGSITDTVMPSLLTSCLNVRAMLLRASLLLAYIPFPGVASSEASELIKTIRVEMVSDDAFGL